MRIGELSKETGISTHTVRYYEKMGLLDKAGKNSSGHRVYNKTDLDLINWVVCLKKSGMPLEKIKLYVKAYKENDTDIVSEMLELHLKKLQQQHEDVLHYIEVTAIKLNRINTP